MFIWLLLLKMEVQNVIHDLLLSASNFLYLSSWRVRLLKTVDHEDICYKLFHSKTSPVLLRLLNKNELYPRLKSIQILFSGIVYCFSRKDSEDVTMELQKRGISCGCYHADIHAKNKSSVHRQWLSNQIQVCDNQFL